MEILIIIWLGLGVVTGIAAQAPCRVRLSSGRWVCQVYNPLEVSGLNTDIFRFQSVWQALNIFNDFCPAAAEAFSESIGMARGHPRAVPHDIAKRND